MSESDQTLSVLPDKYVPTTLPGSRALYVQLIKEGNTISTLDLFEKEYALLVGSSGNAWQTAADHLAIVLSLHSKATALLMMEIYLILRMCGIQFMKSLPKAQFLFVLMVGHVAWRREAMVQNLKDVLNRVLCACT